MDAKSAHINMNLASSNPDKIIDYVSESKEFVEECNGGIDNLDMKEADNI